MIQKRGGYQPQASGPLPVQPPINSGESPITAHGDLPTVIPGDSITSSPEFVAAVRRCFPLLPDAEIVKAFASIAQTNELYQALLDRVVDRDA